MDQVSVKKVASLAFLLVIMLLMMALPPASEAVPTLMKKNNNNGTANFLCKNGLTEEEESCHHIANDYLDMEFMMGSGISRIRMLGQQPASNPAYNANNNARQPACGKGRGKPYAGCSPNPRKGNPPPETSSPYKRNKSPP